MCSVDNTDLAEEAFMPVEEKITLDDVTKCRRCTLIDACVVLRRKHPYCKDCFLGCVTHKLKATLGKSKLMRPADKVMVAFSGGQSSLALLHMLWLGKQGENHKKLLYNIVFCFIDDGAVLKQTLDERKETASKNKDLVVSYGFNFHLTTLHRSLVEEEPVVKDVCELNESQDMNLQQLFASTSSLTAKEDLLLKLRQRLLVKMAELLQCNKMFTAESQTRLAEKLMTSVALGRGEQLSLEVGFQDSRYPGLLILRPMRDIENKEVAFYNQFHGLSNSTRPSFTTGLPNTASIRKLTGEFINGLTDEFPSTVSTIFRTGEKLSTASNSETDVEDVCLLCRGKALRSSDVDSSYSAVDATAFSRVVSRPIQQSAIHDKANGCCGNCSCAESTTFTPEQLKACFCYGCLLILREMSSMELLPSEIKAQMTERSSLLSMREQISEFLL